MVPITVSSQYLIPSSDTRRVSPCARARREVAPARIPLDVGDTVVIGGAQVLDDTAPFFLRGAFPTTGVVRVEVKIPELELRLARRPYRRKNDMTTTG